MMQRYRFVGCFTEIGDRTFSRFGQSADWDEAFYQQIVATAPFIPESEFRKIPFDQEELDRYADFGNRTLAPESFSSKIRQSHAILAQIRAGLSTRSVSEEIASEEPAACESGN